MVSKDTILTTSWGFGALLILAIPQVTLYAKIVGLQMFSVAFVIIIRGYGKLYCNWFYKLLITLVFSLPLVSMVLFLRKMLWISDLTSIISSMGASTVVFLLPGATIIILLKLIWKIKVRFLEALPLSFILSLLVASVVALLLRGRLQFILFYSVTTLLFLLLIIRNIFQRKAWMKILNLVNNENTLNVFLISLSAIMIIFTLYPNVTFIPGYDISRHYASAIGFIINPERIRGPYPAFWSHIAIVYDLSRNPSPFVLNTILEFWTLMLLVTIYILTRECYSSLHASIATYLYFFGAGLSWIYILKLADEGKTWVKDLGHVFFVTNADIGYGLGTWIWLWYRPVTIGTLSLFLLMHSLLCKNTDNRVRWFTLLSIPIVLMNYHPSEIILSLILIFGMAIVMKLDINVITTFIVGIVVGTTIRIAYTPYNLHQILLFSSITIITILLSYPLSIYIRKLRSILSIRAKNSNIMNEMNNVIYMTIMTSFILTICYYILSVENFSVSLASLPVPLYYYVILLGVPGILAFISFLSKDYIEKSSRNVDKVLVSIMLLSFFFGKAITYINESQFAGLIMGLIRYTYFERRVVASLVYPIICILASRFFNIIKEVIKKQFALKGEKR